MPVSISNANVFTQAEWDRRQAERAAAAAMQEGADSESLHRAMMSSYDPPAPAVQPPAPAPAPRRSRPARPRRAAPAPAATPAPQELAYSSTPPALSFRTEPAPYVAPDSALPDTQALAPAIPEWQAYSNTPYDRQVPTTTGALDLLPQRSLYDTLYDLLNSPGAWLGIY